MVQEISPTYDLGWTGAEHDVSGEESPHTRFALGRDTDMRCLIAE